MASRTIRLRAYPDPDAKVFCVTGENYHGITFEAETIEEAIERAKVIVPDLLEVNGEDATGVEIMITELKLVPAREITLPLAPAA